MWTLVGRGAHRPTPGLIRAFTLLEVMLTMSLVVVLIASSMSALLYLNSASARLADHTENFTGRDVERNTVQCAHRSMAPGKLDDQIFDL